MNYSRCILLKYGELILKGLNRPRFEAQMMRQIRRRLRKIGTFEIFARQSTVYILPQDDNTVEDAYDAMTHVFGVASLCIAYQTEKNMESITKAALEIFPPLMQNHTSFKVDAKRSDKYFPLTSPQIMREIGGLLSEEVPEVPVDVVNPDIVCMIEIREKCAYLHAGQSRGAGGMPLASNGRGLLLLSGGIDSPVAGYMLAKRGVEIEALHFHSFPYTSERALEKVKSLATLLCAYTEKMRFHTICLTELQLAIQQNCAEEFFTLLLRRSMMRLAQRCARRFHSRALITGESIGQVASQTMMALGVTDAAVEMPVFRPCIGMDKEEIITISRKIDTFDTSVQPYEDCCTVFTPRHPKTCPTMEQILAEEQKLDFAALENKAFETLTSEYIKGEHL